MDGLAPQLAGLGRTRLVELSADLEPSWQQRPRRRRPIRPLIPTTEQPSAAPRRQVVAARDEVWDDRAERDARGLVALLLWPAARCRAPDWPRRCTARRPASVAPASFSGPRRRTGCALLEHADQLQLVTAPDVGQLVEAFLNVPPPEGLSQAALEALAIVAYEQPVSRADISQIRGTDSAGVVDTLLARKLIADDARFGGRGRPAFLVTTDRFLQVMGLGSLAELPVREAFSDK